MFLFPSTCVILQARVNVCICVGCNFAIDGFSLSINSSKMGRHVLVIYDSVIHSRNDEYSVRRVDNYLLNALPQHSTSRQLNWQQHFDYTDDFHSHQPLVVTPPYEATRTQWRDLLARGRQACLLHVYRFEILDF